METVFGEISYQLQCHLPVGYEAAVEWACRVLGYIPATKPGRALLVAWVVALER